MSRILNTYVEPTTVPMSFERAVEVISKKGVVYEGSKLRGLLHAAARAGVRGARLKGDVVWIPAKSGQHHYYEVKAPGAEVSADVLEWANAQWEDGDPMLNELTTTFVSPEDDEHDAMVHERDELPPIVEPPF